MLKTSRKGAGVRDVLPWGHLLTAGALRGRQKARRREEKVKIQEELAEFSTAAESLRYSPFPCSLMLGPGSPFPTLSSVGEWAAERGKDPEA